MIAPVPPPLLSSSSVNALVSVGATTTVYEVFDPLQLPFAVQCLVDNPGAEVSVVVAIGFMVEGAHWCSKEVRNATHDSLTQNKRCCWGRCGRGRGHRFFGGRRRLVLQEDINTQLDMLIQKDTSWTPGARGERGVS